MKIFAKIVYGVLPLIVGLILLFVGVGSLSSSNVTCGSETMSQGDTCDQYTNGVQSGANNYAQQQQSNQGGGIFMIIFGLGMALFGGFIIFLRPKEKSAVPPTRYYPASRQMNARSQAGTPRGFSPPASRVVQSSDQCPPSSNP
jgi:hypothetical protein